MIKVRRSSWCDMASILAVRDGQEKRRDFAQRLPGTDLLHFLLKGICAALLSVEFLQQDRRYRGSRQVERKQKRWFQMSCRGSAVLIAHRGSGVAERAVWAHRAASKQRGSMPEWTMPDDGDMSNMVRAWRHGGPHCI